MANGIGLKTQMKAFVFGGDTHESEDKTSERGEQEHDCVALCTVRSAMAERPTKTDTSGVSKHLFYLPAGGVYDHDSFGRHLR